MSDRILLMDFSNIAYATYYAMQGYNNDEFETEEGKIRYWKFMMLNSIKKNRLKHNPDEYIICADSRSWRKKAFPYYKAKREQMRKESDMDFQFFIENMKAFIKELEDVFPFKVMQINGAEADDIIAVLAQHLAKTAGTVVIASNDKDFKQLVKGNIVLWSFREEKFIEVENSQEFLIAHILRGDSSDGIPNVRSDDDTFIVDGKRQKPCGPKLISKILEQGLDEWLDENDLHRNYKRNQKLICLDQNSIPKKLWDVCVKKYESLEDKKGNYTNILKYLSQNRCKGLIEQITHFM